MAYTTVDKIKSYFRKIKIDTDTSVTTTDITQWISEYDAIINSRLYPYYVTPIDEIASPFSYLIVGKISAMFVSHQVKTVLEMTSQKSDKEQEVQTNLEKKAYSLLDDLLPTFDKKTGSYIDPIMPLTDAVQKDFAPDNDSIFSSQSLEPTFTKGGDNW